MAAALLDEGIYVIGFYFPVVPKGEARIRVPGALMLRVAIHESSTMEAYQQLFVYPMRVAGSSAPADGQALVEESETLLDAGNALYEWAPVDDVNAVDSYIWQVLGGHLLAESPDVVDLWVWKFLGGQYNTLRQPKREAGEPVVLSVAPGSAAAMPP